MPSIWRDLFGKLVFANGALLFVLLLLSQAFGVDISDTVLIVCFATMNCVIAAVWAFLYWRFRRNYSPEQRAAMAAASDVQGDRENSAKATTRYKRDVLRTGVKGLAVVTAAENLRLGGDWGTLFEVDLAVTVGADTPYVVRTGEFVPDNSRNAVKVGRELAVRADPNDRERVAVDWAWVYKHLAVTRKQAEQQLSSPAWRQEQIDKRVEALETLRTKGVISDAEYRAKRDRVVAEQ